MAGFGISRIFSVIVLAVAWAVSLPAAAVQAFGRLLLEWPSGATLRFLPPTFGQPALAMPTGPQIDAAHYHANRHEAGLARLGAVRHR